VVDGSIDVSSAVDVVITFSTVFDSVQVDVSTVGDVTQVLNFPLVSTHPVVKDWVSDGIFDVLLMVLLSSEQITSVHEGALMVVSRVFPSSVSLHVVGAVEVLLLPVCTTGKLLDGIHVEPWKQSMEEDSMTDDSVGILALSSQLAKL
jgi:hypothetical protein